ncbi:hypothetical protein CPG38_13685 [Malaciobacter marinus]|uniref:hypothetical protein n=1 Tax=Malaciobacter marinus TaxID=505249 RepID=UPI000C07A44F|nr:hypothetical protein [Malaciobacter marinus]PHO11320.1 hypothetical protein CPG38_13685 [Malaciobacter marinus]
MNLQDLREKENLTASEKKLLKALEHEEKLKEKLKENRRKISIENEKIKKKRTHHLIVIASEILQGCSYEELEKLANLSKSNKELFLQEMSEKLKG